MRAISKIGVSLVIGVIFLSACKGKSDKVSLNSFDDQAYFESVRSKAYKSKTSEQIDITALSGQLPDVITLKYSNIDYNKASGATTLSDVNLTFADSDIGVNIETLSLWDLNEAALSARISGDNLDSEFSLLGRLEARNLSAIGLETLFAPMMDASNALNQKMVDELGGGDLGDIVPEQAIDEYEISLGSLIVTDLKVHPWVLSLTPSPFDGEVDGPEVNAFWHGFQKAGAWSHAVSYENMVAHDGVIEMTMSQYGMPSSLDMNYGLIGYKGYSRGDMDYAVIRDMNYVMDSHFPVLRGGTKPMKTTAYVKAYSYEKMYLSQVMKHLAIGQMPDRNQTDFMSLGIWKGKDIQMSIDDQALYSLESYEFDMSKFHGVIPEIFELRVENAKYNIGGFMTWVENLTDAFQVSDEQKAETQKTFNDVMGVLSKHNMAEPSFDFHLTAHWDAQTGVTDMGYGFGIDDIGRLKTRFEGVLPRYDAVADLWPEDMEDLNGSEIEELFERTMAFKSYSSELKDEGFDTLLDISIDLAKMFPSDEQPALMLRNATPQQLRQMMAGGLGISSAVVAEEFPPAMQYLNALTDFITNGGTFKVDFEARSPLTVEDFENLSPESLSDPDRFEEMFKLDVSVSENK